MMPAEISEAVSETTLWILRYIDHGIIFDYPEKRYDFVLERIFEHVNKTYSGNEKTNRLIVEKALAVAKDKLHDR